MKKILFIATMLCLVVTAVADTPAKKQFANGFIKKIDGIVEREYADPRSELIMIRCAVRSYYDIDLIIFSMKVYLMQEENARLHKPWRINDSGCYEAAIVINDQDIVLIDFNDLSKKLRLYYLDLDKKHTKF